MTGCQPHCSICCKPCSPSKYAKTRQKVCNDSDCKKAAKKQRQAHWQSRNPEYFRGPENCQRVRQWRERNPDRSRRKAETPNPPPEKSSRKTKSCNTQDPAFSGVLQDLAPIQSALLVGLASAVSGAVLQDVTGRSEIISLAELGSSMGSG